MPNNVPTTQSQWIAHLVQQHAAAQAQAHLNAQVQTVTNGNTTTGLTGASMFTATVPPPSAWGATSDVEGELIAPQMPGIDATPIKKATKKPVPANGATFGDLVRYSGLTTHKVKHSTFEKALPKRKYEMLNNESLFGIEIEVENCPSPPEFEYYWSAKADGSLRNHGAEFVSLPLKPNQIEYALNHLTEKVIPYNPNPDFSNRTSVHVHMNARDFTQDNLYCFVLLYSIFERHFYKFVGTKRETSIFCVPLYKTNYLRRLDEFIYSFRANWSKYCGLNLAPMFQNQHTATYGTVEFRHLYGTFDPAIILPWINSIIALRAAALKWKKNDLIAEIKKMNTVSSYAYLYREVFGDLAMDKLTKEDFEFCISQVKKELFRSEFSEKLARTDSCIYFSTLRDLGT